MSMSLWSRRAWRSSRSTRMSRGAWRWLREDLAGLRHAGWGAPRLTCQRVAACPLHLERLEPRQLLAAYPIISEFLARNDGGLRDGDGRASDWIEILNAGDAPVDLNGYRLTNDRVNLSKFVFPSVHLDAGQRLVVFASGQEAGNYVDAAGNYHTNFTLQRSGDYLALVAPDSKVVSEFGPHGQDYPAQMTNVSYGSAESLTLVSPSDTASYLVPLDGSLETGWSQPEFDASSHGFAAGTASLGFEDRPTNRVNFTGAFQTQLASGTHAVYSRIEFPVNSAAAITSLRLRLKYDNGFIAYLNGVKVAEDNAPASPTWVSTAVASRPSDSEALEFAEFDLTPHLGQLVNGTNVLALHGLNNVSDMSDMLLVAELVAAASDMQAATGQPAKVGYIATPTPGAPNPSNTELYSGFVADTRFSVDRGFYYAPFPVEITTESPGAEIRYTTDGSLPAANTGTVYTGPITISTTTTLRAAAFYPGWIPANVDTLTYVFPDAVMRQDASYIPPDSASWGHAGSDWEMDPDVVNHADPESRARSSDLLTLPTVSLVMNWAEMFGDDGIYIRGESVEKATSIEMIYPDGAEGFQIDGSVQIVGGTSPDRWKSDKLSMRLKFNREYGSGDLEFPVFGDDAAWSFDTLVLDHQLNNVWHYGGGSEPTGQQTRAQYVRDCLASDIQNAMGGYASHDTYVFLYINGILWGISRLHERPDDNFAASYMGGDNEDYDIMKHNQSTAVSGTTDSYRQLLAAAAKDLSVAANYEVLKGMLDIDNFIDYMLGNFYGGNLDWAHQNWYASRNRVEPNGRWRFHSWDAEKYFHALRDDVTSLNNAGGPTAIHQQLVDNPEYVQLFADHVQRHMFNGGVLTPESMTAMYQKRLDEIDDAIRIESARWGDNQRAQPYTRGNEYVTERDRLLNDYFPQRTSIVLDQLKRRKLYPAVVAPTLSQYGGVVDSSSDIVLSAPQGTIYYTTDGGDPRLAGGAVSANAATYTSALRFQENTTLKARVLRDGTWSALVEAPFLIASAVPLRITEINYHPHAANPIAGMPEADVENDRFEFVEIMNVGAQAIDLGGVQLRMPRCTMANSKQRSPLRLKSLAPVNARSWCMTAQRFQLVTGTRCLLRRATTAKTVPRANTPARYPTTGSALPCWTRPASTFSGSTIRRSTGRWHGARARQLAGGCRHSGGLRPGSQLARQFGLWRLAWQRGTRHGWASGDQRGAGQSCRASVGSHRAAQYQQQGH